MTDDDNPERSSRVRLKVCCIASIDEAALAFQAGAHALGLVSAMPSGPGVIDDATVADIAAAVRGFAAHPPRTFLLTARTEAQAIARQHRAAGTTTLQLVDHVPQPELRRLRDELPGIELVQVIHVTGPGSIDQARAAAPWVDALLLDSGNPALAVKELGGTGRTHDWALSRRIREAVSVPVFLAGGLRPANVGEALAAVGPFGLDVCTGVRTDGRLDAAKLLAFAQALQAA
jgi:phosphoribosylanthranilate isomerase